MSPRSARSSASVPSKPPALISTPTSSPTPLTWTVTAPPATVPSTTVSASRAWALGQLLLHLLGLLEQGVHVEASAAERLEGVLAHGLHTSRSAGGHWCGISSIICAPSSRWSSSAALTPWCSASRSSGRASASAVAQSGPDCAPRLVGRPGLLDRLAGGGARGGRLAPPAPARPRARVPGRRRRCGLGGGRLRAHRGGLGDRGRALGLGAGVDDRVDLPVRADDVDRGLAQHVVAPAAHERVAGAGVGEAQGEGVAVDRDDLAVLGEVHPGEPAHALGRVDDVGPQAAYVDQGERAGRGRGGLSLRRGCGGLDDARRGPAGSTTGSGSGATGGGR